MLIKVSDEQVESIYNQNGNIKVYICDKDKNPNHIKTVMMECVIKSINDIEVAKIDWRKFSKLPHTFAIHIG